jgi:NAD(P)-dependent dehydrogenase (short-subunit alcohol dehydrogenase family)
MGDALRELAGAGSYGGIGYEARRRRWAAADRDDREFDLAGKVCVVTGGTAGVGLATAHGLAALGATVVIVGRSAPRGEAALREIKEACGHHRVFLELADVASVRAVHALAERIKGRHGRVDVLVNNAGASYLQRHTSADGHEMTFATNVLGGFVLTHALLPLLLRAAPSRVLHMTSIAIYVSRLDVDALLSKDPESYHPAIQYANTKRAQVELNALWASRLLPSGVTSSCVHPGLCRTPGVAANLPLYHRVFGPVLRAPTDGADTAIWLAGSSAAAARTGEIWFDRAPRPAHLVPWTRSSAAEAERLWAACAELGGVGAYARAR